MHRTIVLALGLAALTASGAAAQEPWSWHKALAAGKTIEIKNIEGDITATPASGNEVEVVAHRHGNTRDVQIKVDEDADGVTICTVYGDADDCVSRDHRHSRWNNDVDDGAVDFEVRVPRGVRFAAHSVSGEIEATGLTADVDVGTVSGDVRVATTGLVEAASVSGSLNVRMGRADWDGTLEFTTVSGDITVEMPATLNASVHYNTVSGDFDSDWPVTMRSTFRGRGPGRANVDGTIGTGGRELRFSTVSGDVELRKAP